MGKTFFNKLKAIASIMLIISICLSLNNNFKPTVEVHADTQEEYDKLNKELEELKSKQANLDSKYSQLNNELITAGEKLSSLESAINDKQLEIDIANEELDLLDSKIAEQKETMKLRIKYMYENGTSSSIELLLSAGSLSDLLNKIEYIQQISAYDHDKMIELNDMIKSQTAIKEALETDLQELLVLQADAKEEQNSINALIAECKTTINSNTQSIKDAEALALEYEKRIEEEMRQRQLAEMLAAQSNSSVENTGAFTPGNYDAYDLALLAAIIECEAGNQSYEGKCAVGSVIMNRVSDPRFANTIEGVIYAPYQFSPAASGRLAIVLARGAMSSCVEAAAAVLNGYINIDALYFHGYDPSSGEKGTVIGDHIFM